MTPIEATNIARHCFAIALRRQLKSMEFAEGTFQKYSKLALSFIDQGDPAERLMALLMSLEMTEKMYEDEGRKPESAKAMLESVVAFAEGLHREARVQLDNRSFI